MKRASILALLMALTLAGCFIPADERGPAPGPSPDNPAPSPATDDQSIWSALADRIDKGQIRDTDELLSIVRDLKAAGDVTDATPFAEAFPTMASEKVVTLDIPEKRKPISDKLRTLK